MSRTITDERLVALMRQADPVTDTGSSRVLSPHEERLLAQVLVSDPGESPNAFLPRPRPRRLVLLSVTSTGGVAAAATAAALILSASSTPSVAFAGWSSSPTTPASGQVQSAEAECQDQEHRALASLKPTLVDTRGPYTLLIYGQSQGGVCRTGPKFAGARVNLFQIPHLPGGWRGPSLAGPSAANQIRTISEGADYIDTEEQRYAPEYGPNTIMYCSDIGRVGNEVTGVTLTLRDGEQVEATTENGWYAAWWPARGDDLQSSKQSVATSAQITTPTGTITQQLEAEGSNG